MMLLIFGCSQKHEQFLSSDEYCIYSAVIDSLYPETDSNSPITAVITDTTSIRPLMFQIVYGGLDLDVEVNKLIDSLLLVYPGFNWDTDSLVEKFKNNNDIQLPICLDSLYTRFHTASVSYPKFNSYMAQGSYMFGNPGWNKFYRDYSESTGVISLSRIGFNHDRSQALLFTDIQSTIAVSAQGCIILLKKIKSDWHIDFVYYLWNVPSWRYEDSLSEDG